MARWMERIHTFTASTGVAGQGHLYELGSILTKTRRKRPTVIRGFIFDITVQYDVVMATLTAAVPGWRLWGAIRNLELTMAGHRHIQGLHGDEVNHITKRLLGAYKTAEPQDVADTDATNATRAARFFVPCTIPLPAEGAELDFALPVLGKPTLKFDVAGTSEVGPAGFTFDLVTGEIWAVMGTADELRQPPKWAMRRIGPKADLDFSFDTVGFARVVDIRDRASTTEQDTQHDDYDAIQVTIGDDVYPVMDSDELVIIENEAGQEYPDYAENDATTPEYIGLIPPIAPRTMMSKWTGPDARVNVKIGTRSDHTTTTVLVFETGTFDGEYEKRFFEAIGATGKKVVVESRPARGRGTPAALYPYIPRAVHAAGLQVGEIAQSKSVAKYAGKLT